VSNGVAGSSTLSTARWIQNFISPQVLIVPAGTNLYFYNFLYRASPCFIELKDSYKLICFSQTRQYLFALLATGFGH
jgi:hypothetical protein